MGRIMSIIISELIKYQRTDKGTEEVSKRTHQLSARQRQFLLLIDKTDALNQQICKKLFNSINIEQLVDLGLLSTADKIETIHLTDTQENIRHDAESAIELKESQKDNIQVKTTHDTHQALKRAVNLSNCVGKNTNTISSKFLIEQPEKYISYDEFAEIKKIMMMSLRQTCGLLAADLMILIEKAPNPRALRKLTARWRTTMLESKFDKTLMEAWFNDVKTRLG